MLKLKIVFTQINSANIEIIAKMHDIIHELKSLTTIHFSLNNTKIIQEKKKPNHTDEIKNQKIFFLLFIKSVLQS